MNITTGGGNRSGSAAGNAGLYVAASWQAPPAGSAAPVSASGSGPRRARSPRWRGSAKVWSLVLVALLLMALPAVARWWDPASGLLADASQALPGSSIFPSDAAPGVPSAPAAPADGSAASTDAGKRPAVPDDSSDGDSAALQAAGGGTAWALWTARSGTVIGSRNRDTWTNSTESMIKPWVVADFLRRLGMRQPTESQRADASRAIVHSDDQATERLYRAGGRNAVVHRMIEICRLTDTRITRDARWAYTHLTAADAVRLGRCIADGRAAGPQWTPWVLGQMRAVRGSVAEEPNGGRWGIIDALPAGSRAGVAIKNGWTSIKADQMWHLNCLAVTDRWVLSVLTRYPAERGKGYGARICRERTTTLLKAGVLSPP